MNLQKTPLHFFAALLLVVASNRGTEAIALVQFQLDDVREVNPDPEQEAPGGRDRFVDADVEPWRVDLLRQAFAVASSIPEEAHPKDRAKVQAEVLRALLELHQPTVVEELLGRIGNWRRAEVLAVLALYAARNDYDPKLVRSMIARSDRNHPADLDRWRHDRIDANLARALVRIGDDQQAARLESSFEMASQGQVVEEKIHSLKREDVDRVLFQIQRIVEQGQFDQVLNAIDIMVAMHARFYDDPELRSRLQQTIDESAVTGKIPHGIRVRSMLRLVDEAVRQEDLAHARMVADRSLVIFDSIQSVTPFPPEFGISLMGDIARRRAESGDIEGASEQIRAARALYQKEPRLIPDVFRAGAFRPVLAATMVLDRPDEESSMARFVLECGATNPNARPRAQDLARTLVVMALQGEEPGDALLSEIQRIRDGLVAPW